MLRIENIEDFTDYLQKNPADEKNFCCKRTKDNHHALSQIFCKLFDKLEKIPVTFFEKKEETHAAILHYAKYARAGEMFIEYLEQNNSRHVFHDFEKIWQRIIGFNYRIQKIHGGVDPMDKIDMQLFHALLDQVEIFKSKQVFYKNTTATEKDVSKIMEVSHYFTFGKCILKYTDLRDRFFKWSLRDNNSIATFIEFPGTTERLTKAFLDKRVGYFNPQELGIIFENQQKIIKLPFYDGEKINRVNILDESQEVTLNHFRKMTIKEIFDIFAGKKVTPGDVEYFGPTGIMNWASYEFGPYNSRTHTYDRIDFNKEKWWELLPVFERISQKKLEKRYHIILKKNEWVQTLHSTREQKNFDLMKRHGFIEIAIPAGDEQYLLFPFGKYPADFPTRTLDKIKVISKTVLGKMQFPDENRFYSQREHAAHATAMSEELGLQKMHLIKETILTALENNLTFHYGGPNCAFFADSIAGTDCFNMPFSEMKPASFAQEFFLRCPLIFQPYISSIMQWMANNNGINVKENGKSVYKYTIFAKTFHEAIQAQPAKLFQQIEEKKLNGVIRFGN